MAHPFFRPIAWARLLRREVGAPSLHRLWNTMWTQVSLCVSPCPGRICCSTRSAPLPTSCCAALRVQMCSFTCRGL